MAEEEKKQQDEQAEEPQAQEDAPSEEEAKPEASEEEAGQDEAGDAEDANEEAAEEAPPEAAEAPAAGGDEDELPFKARRRLERSRQSGPPGPQRSPEERAAERDERRRRARAQRRAYRLRRRQKKGEPGQGTPPAERESVAAKVRQGRVVSNKANKTISVQVEAARRHSTYEKIVRRSATLQAHDERNEANEGDVVRVVETRPLSRTKRWRLLDVLERAK